MNTKISTETVAQSFNGILVEDVYVRSAWCNVYPSYQVDSDGYDFTLVELVHATDEGEPMADIEINGHVSELEVMKVLVDVARGVTPDDVHLAWANSYGQVA